MIIRKAENSDLDVLVEIYENAKEYMHSHGNPTQWNDGHPNRDDLIKDIEMGQLYVIEVNDEVEMSFVYFDHIEPTYLNIEGEWLNDEKYGVFHRVASRMRIPKIANQMIQFGKERIDNIRIDTHKNNKAMQNLLTRNGFVYTGVIYLEDGNPRNAYHWSKKL